MGRSAEETTDELRSRLPVWVALSELWLDTSLGDREYDYIAKLLAHSPYSISELQKIHIYEVAPAVSANLFSMAGVWAGFDEEWLLARCTHYHNLRNSCLHHFKLWLQMSILTLFTKGDWKQIILRINRLRMNPENSSSE